jgi:hypothetical protein
MTLDEIKTLATQAGLTKSDIAAFGNPAKKDTWITALATKANVNNSQTSQQILNLLNEVENPAAKAELQPILERLATLSSAIERAS